MGEQLGKVRRRELVKRLQGLQIVQRACRNRVVLILLSVALMIEPAVLHAQQRSQQSDRETARETTWETARETAERSPDIIYGPGFFTASHTDQNAHTSDPSDLYPKIPFTHLLYANKSYGVYGRDRQNLKSETLQPGDERSFFVRNVVNPTEWTQEMARLMVLTKDLAVWFRTKDIGEYYHETDMNMVIQKLLHETGSGSINPNKGILPLLENTFGRVPGGENERLHLLFLDIEDRFEETGMYVAGFFDPVNGLDHPFSNGVNLLYIDLYPGFYTGSDPGAMVRMDAVTATIAHELQHAIHSVIPVIEESDLFINEGFSELAEIITGHTPRDADLYFRDPLRPLFSWDYVQPLPDYSRASLFFHYVFEQTVGGFMREFITGQQHGITGLHNALKKESNRSLEELFLGWGQALLGVCLGELCPQDGQSFNGYSHPIRADLRFPLSDQEQLFPQVLQTQQPAWSHQWITYPFTSRAEIRGSLLEGDEDVEYWTSLYKMPGSVAPTEVQLQRTLPGSTVLRFGEQADADSDPHQTLVLLRTKLGREGQRRSTFLVDGSRTAIQDWQLFGDGKPEVFDGKASYLLLSPGMKIALEFERETSGWLRGGRVKVIHLSEVTGSGVAADTEREVMVSLMKQTGNGWETIVSPFVHRMERESGMLFFESIRWPDHYKNLADVSGRFRWVLEPVHNTSNLFAVGMQPMTKPAVSGRQTAIFLDGVWSGISNRFPHLGLHNWGAVMEIEWVRSCCFEILDGSVSVAMDFSPGNVAFTIQSPEPIATTRSRLVAQLPDRSYVEGKWLHQTDTEPDQQLTAVASFPLQTGGTYHVTGILASTETDRNYKIQYQGSIDTNRLITVTGNYPNPFNPSTKIKYTILERSDVRFRVFDLLGRELYTVPQSRMEPGEHQIELDLSGYATGMYLVRAESTRLRDAGLASSTAKILMVR